MILFRFILGLRELLPERLKIVNILPRLILRKCNSSLLLVPAVLSRLRDLMTGRVNQKACAEISQSLPRDPRDRSVRRSSKKLLTSVGDELIVSRLRG